MRRFETPTCGHLEARGDLAPIKADWWYCPVRAREIYHGGQCRGCSHHQPGHVVAPAIQREASMAKKSYNWDGPAQDVVPEANEELTLREWAKSVGTGPAAKRLGCSWATAQNATRPVGEKRKPGPRAKKQADEPGTLDKATRQRVAAAQEVPQVTEPPFLAGSPTDEAPAAPPKLERVTTADAAPGFTAEEYAAYIADLGRAKHFEVWVSGYRAAKAIWVAGRVAS